jgi:dsDNA-specific endonuclease/ATPase MutS2
MPLGGFSPGQEGPHSGVTNNLHCLYKEMKKRKKYSPISLSCRTATENTRTNKDAAELDLHRLTVDEAIPRIDEFLHSSYKGNLYRVWIIHGIGSGILRREVRRYLSGHTLVSFFTTADGSHGGRGATQVDLSER